MRNKHIKRHWRAVIVKRMNIGTGIIAAVAFLLKLIDSFRPAQFPYESSGAASEPAAVIISALMIGIIVWGLGDY